MKSAKYVISHSKGRGFPNAFCYHTAVSGYQLGCYPWLRARMNDAKRKYPEPGSVRKGEDRGESLFLYLDFIPFKLVL